jgi:cellulose synthase/poly-beta-1,6-N-acetylglucosamine synthase-like glycosyltransferase/peptidoglycan/xylan/chitin deacetylase (PgdA/CDA1 family)
MLTGDGRVEAESDARLEEWLRTSGVELPIMPMANNSDGTSWMISELGEMLSRSQARAAVVAQLTAYVAGRRRPGLVLDFEEVPEARQREFGLFVTELAAALHRGGAQLMVALPAADPAYDYALVGREADAVILMDYDQHWLTSASGPIAAQDWFVRNLETTAEKVPRGKLVAAVANYAYDWPEPRPGEARPAATAASFQEALVTALESGVKVEFDPESLNPHYSYADERERTHHVWLTDAVTMWNELKAADAAGIRGTALWRLGSEDPSLWSFFGGRLGAADPQKLADIPAGYDLVLEGDGDVWRILSTPEPGRREIRRDPATGLLVDETYVRFPMPYRIDQIGARKGQIVLSFDDGPDPRFTPEVLDVLRSRGAPATFFVTGIAANAHLGLLQREYREGHEIGNHTYTHPHFDRMGRAQLLVELNLTARLLESVLGARTLLFRPPYGIDHQPEDPEEVALLPVPQGMGYVIVGSRIDPHDWGEAGGGAPPAPEELVRRVLAAARRGDGNIVLLHDGGGDRTSTVTALPSIIDGLRAQGFELVSVSRLLGQTRALTMPPLTPSARWVARIDRLVFDLYHWARLGVAAVFLAGIALVSARALGIGLLALVEKLRHRHPPEPEGRPRVSVLVPAHNEEAAITETVRSVLASTWEPLELIVVDDGSTDRTAELITEAAGGDPRLRLIRQPNRGKAAALNRAFADSTGEIVVTIDADTAIEAEAIALLVRHFGDARVGAVAGNVKVGNRDRWITRWQALEYITSQNLEKRAFDLLDCITVVPGALGAWRASALREAGGLTGDTVAEDTDLTFALRRRGFKITYEEEAIGWTQAPEDVDGLVAQRFRWTFGTLQAVWKHRDTLGRPRYGTLGLVAIPNVFLFQILLPFFSPLIDLLFAGSLALFGLSHLGITRFPELWTTDDVARAGIFFLVFLAIDFLTGVIAFLLERDEEWSLLASFLFQRFYYRQLMYGVLVRSLLAALQGRAVGWRGPVGTPPTPVAA